MAIFYNSSLIPNKNLVTVVLGSKNVEYRWKDTRRLTLWAEQVLMMNKAATVPKQVGVASHSSPLKKDKMTTAAIATV